MYSLSLAAYRAAARSLRIASDSAQRLLSALAPTSRRARLMGTRHLVAVCFALAMSLATSSVLRHSLPQLIANFCILGGVIAAPIVSVVAWIGMVLPSHTMLHQGAGVLFMISVIWGCLAIVGAHMQHDAHSHN